MRERWIPALRLFGWGAAALVLLQMVAFWLREDPLGDVKMADRSWVSGLESSNSVTAPVLPAGPGGPGGPGGGPGEMSPALPPAAQARVERVTESEILGPVMRPLPMALLGIAGKDAFLRTASGQTGLMREGDELGGVRLLRIGTNRVLIEHEKQKKELTLFSGFGGETLLMGKGETPGVPAPATSGN